MFDCAKDVLGYHDDEVTLPETERAEMRDRRNANRDRLKKGLKQNEKPAPKEFKSQGSYAMRTMTQHPQRDYDVDDGVYFAKEDLVGERGAEMSALDARKMVRDALDDGSFNTPPEARSNCVRVYYNAGYHVDVPVYRISQSGSGADEVCELASADWKRSDARDVTNWFDEENARQSPDESNGRQLRRITRLNKKFATSRASWQGQLLSGFGITKLVTERFHPDEHREDRALYDTMKGIHDRLQIDLVVTHPVTPGDTITKGADDATARRFREKLADALGSLAPLFEADCDRETALKCWDKVFATDYFSNRLKGDEDSKAETVNSPSVLTSGLFKKLADSDGVRAAVNKSGGGRYATNG